MSGFKRFEDIPVWQSGRELVREIYAVTRCGEFASDRGLKDQIQRASVSITSNIAEGHERGTTRDLILFLYYAKGSAGEVRSQLWNAEDVGYLSTGKAVDLRGKAAHISGQIFAWVTSMQAIDFAQGPAYHKSPSQRSRRWEAILDAYGLVRKPNGQVVKAEQA